MRRNDRGAALVEMALVLPLIMMLFTGAVNIGLGVIASSSGTNATREAGRVAAIRYECADNHISERCTTNPSTNYNTIKAAAIAKLGGVVPTASVTMSVQCRQNSASGTLVLCEKQYVRPDNDVVVVTLTWGHKGSTRWVPFVTKSSTVAMSIVGRPDLSALAPEPDVFPPALSGTDSCVAKDSDADGDIDRIEMTFDEDIIQSVSAAAFTLLNSVNGSSTISSASVSGRVVTLNLAGTTTNTAIGTMNVSLSAGASGVRDLVGNQASFAGCTLVDKASPKLISITDTNAVLGVNGRMDTLDSIIFTFSEPIGLGLGVTTVIETDPSGTGNDTLQIPGITAGPVDTGSNNYVTTATSSVTFAAVAVAVGNTVVVTLGANTCLVFCPSLGSGDAVSFDITVSTSLGDAGGNLATGTGTLVGGKVF